MRLRTSRRTSSIDHNQMTCPSASEKCSAQVCPPATHGKGEGTVPVSGMSTRCAPTHTSRPKAAPCHSVIDL